MSGKKARCKTLNTDPSRLPTPRRVDSHIFDIFELTQIKAQNLPSLEGNFPMVEGGLCVDYSESPSSSPDPCVLESIYSVSLDLLLVLHHYCRHANAHEYGLESKPNPEKVGEY